MASRNPATFRDLAGSAVTREASRLYWILGSILGVALVLRVWGITFGLPYDFTPDEVHEIVRALKLGAGEYYWNPGKGGLYYLLFVEYGFLFVAWWLTGRVSGPTDFALQYVQDPTAFYIAGRVTVAVMSVVTCLVAYKIAERLYDARTGLIAAFIAATAFYHAMWSHYINVDTGMTLAMWGSLLVYMKYESSRRLGLLVLAGVLAAVSTAFKTPGVLTVLTLLLAIATPFSKWASPRTVLREGAVVCFSAAAALLIIAPEHVGLFNTLKVQFSGLLADATELSESAQAAQDFDSAVHDVTIYRGVSYITLLLSGTNIGLTLAAMLGAAAGIVRRHRWDIIWAALVIVFVTVMSAADRPGTERYLFPILPALWLLGARGIGVIARGKTLPAVIAVAAITAFPIYKLIEQNYTWTQPDTRVIAKEWIEQNVPSGSKILMDGMRYRFIQSPPLNPDESTVARRVEGAGEEGDDLSRGVSGRALELYAEAMARVQGPKYDLHSTVWGLAVQDLTHYVDECFDYVVTSSQIARIYIDTYEAEQYPDSARFYQELPKDPRFREIYSVEPVRWQVQGPAITVYEVLHPAGQCAARS
jgi:hypothetical protein